MTDIDNETGIRDAAIVEVIKPDFPPVYIGPLYRHTAEHWQATLDQATVGTAHPPGTVIRVLDYTPEVAAEVEPFLWDPATLPGDAGNLAEMLRQEPDVARPGDHFPDLYLRLRIHYGAKRADQLWVQACADIDNDTAIGQQVTEFADKTAIASKAVHDAMNAVRQLTGPLYDIELAEGSAGGDAIRELEAAAAHLRNVDRIAHWRKAQERPVGPEDHEDQCSDG